MYRKAPTGIERSFSDEDLVVSKTDRGGRIIYANRLFVDLSGYPEKFILGKTHDVFRHPEMPGCILKLIREKIEKGEDIFAYVLNLWQNGDHCWMFSHIVPSYDNDENISGFLSSSVSPPEEKTGKIRKLYKNLIDVEKSGGSREKGLTASYDRLNQSLQSLGIGYDEFIFSI